MTSKNLFQNSLPDLISQTWPPVRAQRALALQLISLLETAHSVHSKCIISGACNTWSLRLGRRFNETISVRRATDVISDVVCEFENDDRWLRVATHRKTMPQKWKPPVWMTRPYKCHELLHLASYNSLYRNSQHNLKLRNNENMTHVDWQAPAYGQMQRYGYQSTGSYHSGPGESGETLEPFSISVVSVAVALQSFF